MRLFNALLLILITSLLSCSSPPKTAISIDGQTMGTTYRISIPAGTANLAKLKTTADSLLVDINLSLSTYIDSSLISIINASTDVVSPSLVDNHFNVVYQTSKQIHEATEGAFNPAVGPLVVAWGFGPEKIQQVPEDKIDELLALTDFNDFQLQRGNLIKKNPMAQLDFSAIAKGYGVDLLGVMLEMQNITDYLVEIGGEVRSRGMHPAGRAWRVGIDKPLETPGEQREIQLAIELQNNAMATSGNYRNFYVRDGKKYVHTINPFTGYPEESELLSVSVLAENCMTADAYATAFMVMGLDKAMTVAEEMQHLEAYFITTGADGAYVESKTDGFPDAFTPDQ